MILNVAIYSDSNGNFKCYFTVHGYVRAGLGGCFDIKTRSLYHGTVSRYSETHNFTHVFTIKEQLAADCPLCI